MIKNTAITIAIILVFLGAGYASYVLTGHSWNFSDIQIGDETSDESSVEEFSDTYQLSENDETRLEPHRALYDIRLIQSHNTAQIVNISGKMFFEWGETCDAWTTDHRFSLIYEYADSPAMQVTSDFSTWESRDGTTLVFSTRRSRNGELYEDIRGRAILNKDGSGGKVTYSTPEELVIDLPPGTLFPMMHTSLMAAKMDRMNSPFLNATIFDGSDMEGPVEINAFLGKELDLETQDNERLDKQLLSAPARQLHMAFFPLANEYAAAADYEMESVFYRNGVIGDMRIHYDEFSIAQELVAIEPVPLSKDMSECK